MTQICVVEDDVAFGKLLKTYLERKDYKVALFSSANAALHDLISGTYPLVICDIRLPDLSGVDLMKKVKLTTAEVDFIFMTNYANVSSAVDAIKSGGFDYIAKPFHPEQVLEIIANYFSQKANNVPETEHNPTENFILGNAEPTKRLLQHIQLVAPTEFSVIIYGESGSGKEVVAKMLHQKSHRANMPFIAVDCGTIPDDIASSAFFGHVKGAFTGATSDAKGYFENANGGTLFLDEIGNLSYENQIKLLRCIQEKKIQPLGSTKTIAIDVRLIVATNESISSKIKEGTFREDLYHRLNEFSIESPPLRDRGNEILDLAHYFIHKYARKLNKTIAGFDLECTQLFLQYPWPGNIRELENVIKRAVLFCSEKEIKKEHLSQELWDAKTDCSPSGIQKNLVEKNMILRALRIAKGNKSQAAELLQISRKTLYNKLDQWSIPIDLTDSKPDRADA